jgi:hypothetical protein
MPICGRQLTPSPHGQTRPSPLKKIKRVTAVKASCLVSCVEVSPNFSHAKKLSSVFTEEGRKLRFTPRIYKRIDLGSKSLFDSMEAWPFSEGDAWGKKGKKKERKTVSAA